jgi:two-component system sensor histidine kinase/response regulator
VRDTGIGMTPDQVDGLFRPFVQADLSTTREFGGTGLGLTISKSLVELMGGAISIKSEFGKGSKVDFTAIFNVIDITRTETTFPASLQHLRMLVLETHPAMQAWFRNFAPGAPLTIVVVDSALEAIIAVESKVLADAYDIILIDSHGIEGGVITLFQRLQKIFDKKVAAKFILLTAPLEEALREKAASFNVSEFLLSPLTSSSLTNAVINIFAPLSHLVDEKTLNKVDDLQFNGLKVLLVEDNAMNQQIATELLGSVGVEVTLAGNGREAVELLSGATPVPTFDAILMDIQMPEMDGYEATRQIRKIARYAKIPIIAMTAHAMADEREKVAEAGMNDHVAKPIIPKNLFRTLYHWARPGMTMVEIAVDKSQSDQRILPSIPGVNFKEGLARVAGNFETYLRLLKGFSASQRNEVDRIEQALGQKDFETAKTSIHTIKGIAGNLSITALYQASVDFEMALIKSEWDEASRLFEEFQSAFMAFEAATESLLVNSQESPAFKTVDLPQALEIFANIKLALLANNPLARKGLEELARGFAFPAGCADEFNNLKDAVGQFDFEQALQILASLESKLKGEEKP